MEIGFEFGVNIVIIVEKNFYFIDGFNDIGFYNINYFVFFLNNYNFEISWDR